MLSGLADKEQYPAILKVLTSQFNSSPYMEKYVLDAMFYMGYEKEALERMRLRYKEMIDDESTTLWELFRLGWGTKNHAWTGGPMINLSGHVAGVWPETPGYETYHVIPRLSDLNEVRVVVPSVKGDIKVEICRDLEKQEIKLTLDSPAETVAKDDKYVYFLAQPGKHTFCGK